MSSLKMKFSLAYMSVLLLLSSRLIAQEIVACQWWIEDRHSSAEIVSMKTKGVVNEDVILDLGAVAPGTYELNLRFLDDSGRWSGIKKEQVVKTDPGKNNDIISKIAYWYDNNHLHPLHLSTAAQGNTIEGNIQLALNNAPAGSRNLFFRFKNSSGFWSAVSSKMIMKTPEGDSEIRVKALEYWLNNAYEARTLQIIQDASPEIHSPISLDLSSIGKGGHILNVRVMDNLGQFSEINRSYFRKYPSGYSKNSITAYRYWFNDSIESLQYVEYEADHNPAQPVFVIPADGFDHGDTISLSIQFRDLLGQWSGYISDTVYLDYGLGFGDELFVSDDLQVYPNPASRKLILELKNLNLNADKQITIYDLQGHIYYSESENMRNPIINVNIEDLFPGFYIIEVKAGDKRYVRNFVISR